MGLLTARSLDASATKAVLDALDGTYFHGKPASFPPDATVVDISNLNPDEVRETLRSLGVPEMQDVVVIWLAMRRGLALSFGEFVARYDDLWFPSRDDVWVTDRSVSWLLEISHEEVLSFVRQLRGP